MDEVLGIKTYSMEGCTGFRESMKTIKDLGFGTEETNQLQMNDKVYPWGSPQ
jgi:hypothetical protein